MSELAAEMTPRRKKLNWQARLYIVFVTLCGFGCLWNASWDMSHFYRFGCYLVVCILASGLKVNLPGILGTMSVNFLFILIGILDMSAGQTLLMGCLGAMVQCVWKPKHEIQRVQAQFSLANIAVAIFGAYTIYHWLLAHKFGVGTPAL